MNCGLHPLSYFHFAVRVFFCFHFIVYRCTDLQLFAAPHIQPILLDLWGNDCNSLIMALSFCLDSFYSFICNIKLSALHTVCSSLRGIFIFLHVTYTGYAHQPREHINGIAKSSLLFIAVKSVFGVTTLVQSTANRLSLYLTNE